MSAPDLDPDSARGRQAIRKARDAIRPSADFEARLERALTEAEERPAKRPRSSKAMWLQAPLILPAAFSLLIAAYVTWDAPTFDALNVAEHLLEVPVGGEASMPVDLALHHHGSDWADIAVNAPRGLSVATRGGPAALPATCRGNRCRYEFSHRAAHGSPAMHVRVAQPGRYRMEIEHHSRSASVREVFVIHARR